jgi:hypothetical protein
VRWVIVWSVAVLGACASAPAPRPAPPPAAPPTREAIPSALLSVALAVGDATAPPPRPRRRPPPPVRPVPLVASPPYTPPLPEDQSADFESALDLLPLVDEHGRFVLVRSEGSAELYDASNDTRIATYADDEALLTLLAHSRSWRRLVPMAATTDDPPASTERYIFRDRGLRVTYVEPDLTVAIEATGTIVSRRHATWWSAPPLPPLPGQDALPPEERFQCPAPVTVVSDAWITADHRLLVLFADHRQYTCVCGGGGDGRWHVVQLTPS